MYNRYRHDLASLTTYRHLLDNPIMSSLSACLDALCAKDPDWLEITNLYHRFYSRLLQSALCFRCSLVGLILQDDNVFSRTAEKGGQISPGLLQATLRDLGLLQHISELDFAELSSSSELFLPLPVCTGDGSYHDSLLAPGTDWAGQLDALVGHYRSSSRGVMSVHKALRWDATGGLQGITDPHLPELDDLVGYEYQKQLLCSNTEQFLAGHPANNVLLYGSSGTGKSTMIKALLKHYWDRPLRLVEVQRDSLDSLQQLLSLLQDYAMKCILFIDDLSFEDYETGYKGLKAALEGSLASQTDNVLVYATSNRRHLVKEFFHDRQQIDDEIHVFDTQQEKGSLADRFGLLVTFATPAREEYLEIVAALAQRQGLDLDPEYLRQQALQWERARHGPSGRTAQQFITHMVGQHPLKRGSKVV